MKTIREKILAQGNIPIMSDDGIQELLNYFVRFYTEGFYKTLRETKFSEEKVIRITKTDPSRKVMLKDNKRAVDGTITENEVVKTRINVLMYILEDLKKQARTSKGDVIKNIERSSGLNGIKVDDVKLALSLPRDKIEEMIMSGKQNSLPPVINGIYERLTNFRDERQAKIQNLPYECSAKTTMDHDYRIYLHTPEGIDKYRFLELYAKKCIERHIPFDMKGDRQEKGENIDKSVLYVFEEYLDDTLEILEEIKREIPDVVAKFGSPVASGYNYDYYSIGSYGLKGRTYNDWFNSISTKAFLCLSGKMIVEDKQFYETLSNEEKKLVQQLSVLENFKDELCGNDYIDSNAEFLSKYDKQINSILERFLPRLDKVDIQDVSKMYAKSIQLFASYSNFGDSRHANLLICFKEGFYEGVTENKTQETPVEKDKKQIILYNTEELLNSMFKKLEFNNFNEDSIESFIDNIESISRHFQVYSSLEKDFKRTDRYKKVMTVLEKLKKHQKFVPDRSVGSGINEVNKKRYYRDVKQKLINDINELKNKNKR